MKHKKILCSLLLSAAITVSAATAAFATPTDDITAALIRGGVPADQISKVVEYLQRYDVTEEQANKIISKIDAASAKMKGQKDISKVDAATRNAIKKDIVEAIGYLGLKADVGSKTDEGATQIIVTDGNGGKVASADTKSSSDTIKNMDISAIKDAVAEAKAFSQNPESATFVPVSEGQMKKTGTDYGNLMLLGLILMLCSGITAVFNKLKLKRTRGAEEELWIDEKKFF